MDGVCKEWGKGIIISKSTKKQFVKNENYGFVSYLLSHSFYVLHT